MKKYWSSFLCAFLSFCVACQLSHAYPTEVATFQKVGQAFLSTYPTIAHLSQEELVNLSTDWQKRLAKQLHVNNDYRVLDPEKLRFLETLLETTPGKIVMRHGEQQPSKQVESITSLQEKKIAMMRLPDNMQDPPTTRSLVEFFGSMIGFRYIQERLDKDLSILSSKNYRAKIPAELLGGFLNVSTDTKRFLQCINYPPDDQISTQSLLRELSLGMLPWEQESIDFIVGPKTFERIVEDMRTYLEDIQTGIGIAFTHTQQINATQQLVSSPIRRVNYYGFIAVVGENVHVFPEGLYASSGD
ncbi:MAG: hypothetical protein AAGI90_00325 [Chlamydiota bacterium]